MGYILTGAWPAPKNTKQPYFTLRRGHMKLPPPCPPIKEGLII